MTQSWSATRFVILGGLCLVFLVGGFGSWAALSEIDGAVVAPGRIEVEQNRRPVQHPHGGVVAEISVREGDRVSPGQTLITIDTTVARTKLKAARSRLNDVLARRARLGAEADGSETLVFPEGLLEAAESDPEVAELIAGQRELYRARRDTSKAAIVQLRGRKEQIEQQIQGMTAQSEALAAQSDLLDEEVISQSSLLDRGLTQSSRVLALKRNQAELTGRVGDLQARSAEAAERLTEIDAQIRSYTVERREETLTEERDLAVREVEYRETIAELSDEIERSVVTSPVSGFVYGMSVNAPGAVIRAADPIMHVVPDDAPLVIAARIPPIHVDRVFAGQEVLLRFPAFDARTTPELTGEVTQISADAFTDEASGTSYYRSEIMLDEEQQDLLPDGLRLLPGMPVESYLRTDPRSPMSYLVKPLSDFAAGALREG